MCLSGGILCLEVQSLGLQPQNHGMWKVSPRTTEWREEWREGERGHPKFVLFCFKWCVCVHVPAWVDVHQCIWLYKEARGVLELKWQETVSHMMCTLGTEPRSSVTAISSLKHWAISPGPQIWFLFLPSYIGHWTKIICKARLSITNPYNMTFSNYVCVWIISSFRQSKCE